MKTLKDYISESGLPTIYCDLDETLVDFYRGVNTVLKNYGYPEWNDPYWKEFTKDEADNIRWAIVKKQAGFWKNLHWLKDGPKLWSFIKPYEPHILSHATEYMATSKPEKIQWITQNLGINSHDRIHVVTNRGDKKLWAKSVNGKPNILIDDYDKNCEEFRSHGGIAIQHSNANYTISQLKKLGFN